jgi:histidine ammonia-lyase
MNKTYFIGENPLSLAQVRKIIDQEHALQLSPAAIERVQSCHQYLQQKLNNSEQLFYGINTGFGSLCNIRISPSELATLQRNLVESHACGAGNRVPVSIARIVLLLKIQSLAQGHSGVQLSTLQRLIEQYNRGFYPVMYELGSLGASGDLAPLAHLSLPLFGEGELYQDGCAVSAAELLKAMGWEPLRLGPKEGLALLNGTQFSTAYAVASLLEAERLSEAAHFCSAMSVDAFLGHLSPFDARLHDIRPHPGQIEAAAAIRSWLQGSELQRQPKAHVQDPYAFRCIPQVHGASLDTIAHARRVVECEINSVTDNPNLFPDEDVILSGGNFHAQPIALVLDFLAIALAELGSIAERRIYQLISGQRGLPAFLTPLPGLHSGLMIPQYTAASIVSQNKQFCTPASVDSIVSSNGQEDHVSMAANAGTKCWQVVQNVSRLLGIECLTAAQALHFREPIRSSPSVEVALADYRKHVLPIREDRILYLDMQASEDWLRSAGASGMLKISTR